MPRFVRAAVAATCSLLFAFPQGGNAQWEDVSVDYLLPVSTAASWFGCGLSTADFNGDGWDDVTAANSNGDVTLFTGSAEGLEHFLTLEHSDESKGILWVDVDNDGDLDLFAGVLTVGVFLYMQQEDGSLVEDGAARGLPLLDEWDPRGFSAADIDGDLDLDIYISSYHDAQDNMPYENILLQNDGLGFFTDVTESAGVGNGFQHSFQGSFFDFDDDGDQDLWVINDRAVFPNALYRNLGDGTFLDIAEDVGADVSIEAMSATLFDPDNDGDWDMYMTNIENNPNVYLRNANGMYYDNAPNAGIASMQYGWGTLAIDVDGDMLEDLMVATYRFPNTNPYDNHLYMNLGAGIGFEDEIENWPNEQYQLYCLGQLDLDGDRSPDVVAHGNANHAQVLHNTNEDGAARLTVKLVGTESNSHAIGSEIHVFADGMSQMRLVSAGCDYMTQHTRTQFFGMGDADVLDSMIVKWPSGLVEVFYGLPADTALTLVEGTLDVELEVLAPVCPWEPEGWVLPFADDVSDVWLNGEPVEGDTLWAPSSGEHQIEVTWWGEFDWSQTMEVVVEPVPEWSWSVEHPACHGESGHVSWSLPGADMAWWGNDSLATVVSDVAVPAGSHVLMGLYGEGCSLSETLIVEQPDSLVLSTELVQPDCHGETGSLSATVTGGTPPYSLDWGDVNPSALMPGPVVVTVLDSMGCQDMSSLEVVEPDPLVSSANIEYLGITDSVLVSLTIEGGTPPHSIMWSGDIDEAGWTVAPSSIAWLIEDANGCLDLGVLEVVSNPLADLLQLDGHPWSCVRTLDGFRVDGAGLDRIQMWSFEGRLIGEWRADVQPVFLPFSGPHPVVISAMGKDGQFRAWRR